MNHCASEMMMIMIIIHYNQGSYLTFMKQNDHKTRIYQGKHNFNSRLSKIITSMNVNSNIHKAFTLTQAIFVHQTNIFKLLFYCKLFISK